MEVSTLTSPAIKFSDDLKSWECPNQTAFLFQIYTFASGPQKPAAHCNSLIMTCVTLRRLPYFDLAFFLLTLSSYNNAQWLYQASILNEAEKYLESRKNETSV